MLKIAGCLPVNKDIYLGRRAALNLDNSVLGPSIVPKLGSGKIVISAPMWDFYFTKDAFWGVVLSKDGDGLGGVFWRSDLGLVYERGDPQHYEKLVEAAGPPNAGLPKAALGPEVVYDMLIAQGAGTVPCKTRLFAW